MIGGTCLLDSVAYTTLIASLDSSEGQLSNAPHPLFTSSPSLSLFPPTPPVPSYSSCFSLLSLLSPSSSLTVHLYCSVSSLYRSWSEHWWSVLFPQRQPPLHQDPVQQGKIRTTLTHSIGPNLFQLHTCTLLSSK